MLFVIAGPSYVGKKTAIAHFMKLYSFSSIIPYTTKPVSHQAGETEGIQYHYVNEASRRDIENEEFIYDEPFCYGEYNEHTLYAYKKSDIENAIESYNNFIIHASVGNVKKIYSTYKQQHDQKTNIGKEQYNDQLYLIFLDFESELTEQFFMKKQPVSYLSKEEINNRKSGKLSNITNVLELAANVISTGTYDYNRRYSHAKKEIEFYHKNSSVFDVCIKSDKAYDICRKLEKYILPKLQVMPTSPDRIPGPLSDMDIIYMSSKRKNDPLQVKDGNEILESDKLLDRLCGCGLHITLSETIRVIKKKRFGQILDMSMDETDLSVLMAKMYPETKMSKGYILKPNEVILCSSRESIKLPHDVYAIVSSKFSYTQLGLTIDLSTSVIQSGHEGKVHFQIKNDSSNYICIYPGIEVAQLLFYRTIQPAITVYGGQGTSGHSYDKFNVSPISDFRKGNDVLNQAKKPKTGFLNTISVQLNDKIIDYIVGSLLVIIACLFWKPKLSETITNYIIPLFEGSSDAKFVALFAVLSCLCNALIYVAGTVVTAIIQQLRVFVFKMIK